MRRTLFPALFLSMILTAPALPVWAQKDAQATNQNLTKEQKGQLKKQEKANKAQAKAEKAREKALDTKQQKKADKAQDKADKEKQRAAEPPVQSDPIRP